MEKKSKTKILVLLMHNGFFMGYKVYFHSVSEHS